MKKILVLPGAKAQIPLLKKIKALGYSPFVINPYDDSPGFEFADSYAKLDILDRRACLQVATDADVDAVVSDQCDIATEEVAFLAAKLGKAGINQKKVVLFRNKAAMREFSRQCGLRCPEFKLCRSLDEALKFYAEVGGKIIVKPLDSNSSRGVFTVSSQEDLKRCFEQSLKWSISDPAVVCERFIEGTEFTIDGIKAPGCPHVCLAISEKKHFAHNKNIASELRFSHYNPNFDYEKLKQLNDSYVNLSGLEFGLTHAEYKCENGEFYLIEIGARGGGNYISSHIVPCMSGIDNMALLIRMALGENIALEELIVKNELRERCAVLKFFDFADGKVQAINGLDFLDSHPRVIKYEMNFVPGDVIAKPADDSKRLGYFIAYADDSAELSALCEKINRKVTVCYERN